MGLLDAGPGGAAACPPSYAEAGAASECTTPTCVYPEGNCACHVVPTTPTFDGGGATYFSCNQPPLPAGCPSSVETAADAGSCPTAGLGCYFGAGTCSCMLNDAGSAWKCTKLAPGCPATRPRLGSACDLAGPSQCTYGSLKCATPLSEVLRCYRTSCDAGIWQGVLPPLCNG
ncbi:MAG: hypothetical protein ACRENE_22100, partial [Polyangiaceae bacterium]